VQVCSIGVEASASLDHMKSDSSFYSVPASSSLLVPSLVPRSVTSRSQIRNLEQPAQDLHRDS
jgi:hypothetical protein